MKLQPTITTHLRRFLAFCVALTVGIITLVAAPAGASETDPKTSTIVVDGYTFPAQRPETCNSEYDDLSCAWSEVYGKPDTLSMDARRDMAEKLVKLWNNEDASSAPAPAVTPTTNPAPATNADVDSKTIDDAKADKPDATPVTAPAPAEDKKAEPAPASPTPCKPTDLTFTAHLDGTFTFINSSDCSGPIGVGAYQKQVATLDITFPQHLDSKTGKWLGQIGPFATVHGKVTLPCNPQVDGIKGHDLPNQLTDAYFSPAGTLVGAYHFIKECKPPVLKTAACNNLSVNSASPKLGEMMHLTLDGTNVVAAQLVHNGQDIITVDPSNMVLDFAAIPGTHVFEASIQGEDGQWMTAASCQVSYTTVVPVPVQVCRSNSDGSYSVTTVDQDKVNTDTDFDVNSPKCHPPVIIMKCTPTNGQDANCLPFTGGWHTIGIALLALALLGLGVTLISIKYRVEGITFGQQFVIVVTAPFIATWVFLTWFLAEGSFRRSSNLRLS